jgi:hypothetical protein
MSVCRESQELSIATSASNATGLGFGGGIPPSAKPVNSPQPTHEAVVDSDGGADSPPTITLQAAAPPREAAEPFVDEQAHIALTDKGPVDLVVKIQHADIHVFDHDRKGGDPSDGPLAYVLRRDDLAINELEELGRRVEYGLLPDGPTLGNLHLVPSPNYCYAG